MSIASNIVNVPQTQKAPIPNADKGASNLQHEDERKPFPQFNAFRPFVMQELTRRKSTPNSFINEITPVINAPFVRMTSCAESGGQSDNTDSRYKYKFFTLGLHGFTLETTDIFETSYGNGREIVGYAYKPPTGTNKKSTRTLIDSSQLLPSRLSRAEETALTEQQANIVSADRQQKSAESTKIFAHGTHPIPGITDIRISRLGLGTSINATVQWTCYNHAQLEYLRQHFMNVGNHVILEWGQNSSQNNTRKILDFGDDATIMDTLIKSVQLGRKYIIDNWCKKNNGNYDFMVGSVANFQVNLDGRTGVYTCVTNIVSVSEQMWGLNNHMTFINAKKDPTPQDSIKVTTVADFFKVNGLYDSLIRQNMTNPKLIAGQYSRWAADNNGSSLIKVEKPTDFSKDFMSNPDDFTFISWEFLTRVLVPTLFHLLDDGINQNIKRDLQAFIQFFEGDPSDNAPSSTFIVVDENLRKGAQTIWVGDNPNLLSIDPNAMIIIRKNNVAVAPAALRTIGMFDDDPDGSGYRGKLSHGVWLNSEMIRQSFLSSNMFGDGMMKILTSMNNATANYWRLRIYFDEEINRMRIIDESHADFPDKSFYKFNVGGQGECLGITFDSAFPPELITQMQLIAKFHTESPVEQDALLAQYPLIGTTSTFAFSVNWTNLVDALGVALAKINSSAASGQNIVGGTQVIPDNNATDTETKAAVRGGGSAHIGGQATTVKNKKPATPPQSNETPVNQSATTDAAQQVPKNIKSYATLSDSQLPILQADFNTSLSQLITYLNTLVAPGYVKIQERNISQETLNTRYSAGRTTAGPLQIPTDDPQNPHVLGLAVDLQIYNADGTPNSLSDQLLLTYAGNQDVYGGSPISRGRGQTPGKSLTVLEYFPPSEVLHSGHVQYPAELINAQARANPNTPVPRSNADTSAIGNATQQKSDDQLTEEHQQRQTINDYIKKFGREINLLVNFNAGLMISRITQDGYGTKNGYPNKPNNFVSPFPTTTAIGLTVLGISGLSISDGFYVDKLPFIFEKYGCFQLTSVDDTITKDGWLTTLRGYFKLIYIDGQSTKKAPPVITSSTPPTA